MDRQPLFYETHLQWEEKRRGRLYADGLPELKVSTPPEFNGEAGFWTPEHLYVAAAEACLMATFLAMAEHSRLRVVAYHSSALARLEWRDTGGWRFTELVVLPIVELEAGEVQPLAERLMNKAAKGCLIANSILANTRVEPRFEVHPALAA